MKKPTIYAVRCILYRDDEYFLVMHRTRLFSGKKRWGFPGGRVERGEDLEDALRRELREELYIDASDLTQIGDYRYKGNKHRIYAAELTEPVLRFDRSEIHKIGWHRFASIEGFEGSGLLHTGFEVQAIRDFKQLNGKSEGG